MEALIKRNLTFLNIMNEAATRIQAACVSETLFWQNIEQNVTAARVAQAEGKPIEVIPMPPAVEQAPASAPDAISQAAVSMTQAINDFRAKMAEKNPGAASDQPPVDGLPEEENTAAAEQRHTEVQQHGLEMAIKQFFSPLVVHGGRGFYAPAKDQALKSYNADIFRTPLEKQKTWPTGFYRQEDNKARQVFIRTPNHAIILPDSMNAMFQIAVFDLATGVLVNLAEQPASWYNALQAEVTSTLALYNAEKK